MFSYSFSISQYIKCFQIPNRIHCMWLCAVNKFSSLCNSNALIRIKTTIFTFFDLNDHETLNFQCQLCINKAIEKRIKFLQYLSIYIRNYCQNTNAIETSKDCVIHAILLGVFIWNRKIGSIVWCTNHYPLFSVSHKYRLVFLDATFSDVTSRWLMLITTITLQFSNWIDQKCDSMTHTHTHKHTHTHYHARTQQLRSK